ncbi:hypothetical protein SJAG_02714 [Schizosaccharomyces japonicus yFS275]|uniref:Uncharacterized protein n=1 Tax=Schizosaccharomyces japonicus (strain yFS275 / FY16936) TaxID=402676 RepID=B6K0Z6_SCHJY|nr:hypothetical protein SJAG_02714 [Schizosaccharomyces japonicus yFS275]EEB07617.1 hypothetical protein SJAG_02714 [Schizosaccharomyces japonicus yFS275]
MSTFAVVAIVLLCIFASLFLVYLGLHLGAKLRSRRVLNAYTGRSWSSWIPFRKNRNFEALDGDEMWDTRVDESEVFGAESQAPLAKQSSEYAPFVTLHEDSNGRPVAPSSTLPSSRAENENTISTSKST